MPGRKMMLSKAKFASIRIEREKTKQIKLALKLEHAKTKNDTGIGPGSTQIFLRFIVPGNPIIKLNVELEWKVERFKAFVYGVTGAPIAVQTLVHGGKLLCEDTYTLAYYLVEKDSTVYLTVPDWGYVC